MILFFTYTKTIIRLPWLKSLNWGYICECVTYNIENAKGMRDDRIENAFWYSRDNLIVVPCLTKLYLRTHFLIARIWVCLEQMARDACIVVPLALSWYRTLCRLEILSTWDG